MGQQHRTKIKRQRRKNYLKRLKVRNSSTKKAPAKKKDAGAEAKSKAPAKKAAAKKKAPAKKAEAASDDS